MNKLYKIIIFFVIIFLMGIYFTIRSIDTTLSTNDKTEVIYVTPQSSTFKI